MKELKIEIPEGYEIDKEKSTFEKIVFKPLEIKYPKTWEECMNKLNNSKTKFCYITSASELYESYSYPKDTTGYNTLPSKEIAEKFLILQKLYTCRQAYVGDWKPDWTNTDVPKYVIKAAKNELKVNTYYSDNRSFSFPTLEMAEEFLKNFKSDLEFVKDLL